MPGCSATASTSTVWLNSQSALPVSTRAATSICAALIASAVSAASASPLASDFSSWRGVGWLGRRPWQPAALLRVGSGVRVRARPARGRGRGSGRRCDTWAAIRELRGADCRRSGAALKASCRCDCNKLRLRARAALRAPQARRVVEEGPAHFGRQGLPGAVGEFEHVPEVAVAGPVVQRGAGVRRVADRRPVRGLRREQDRRWPGRPRPSTARRPRRSAGSGPGGCSTCACSRSCARPCRLRPRAGRVA